MPLNISYVSLQFILAHVAMRTLYEYNSPILVFLKLYRNNPECSEKKGLTSYSLNNMLTLYASLCFETNKYFRVFVHLLKFQKGRNNSTRSPPNGYKCPSLIMNTATSLCQDKDADINNFIDVYSPYSQGTVVQ